MPGPPARVRTQDQAFLHPRGGGGGGGRRSPLHRHQRNYPAKYKTPLYTPYGVPTLTRKRDCDFNADGQVNTSDLTAFLGSFGQSFGSPTFKAECDQNNSGSVDTTDLTRFLGVFGQPAKAYPTQLAAADPEDPNNSTQYTASGVQAGNIVGYNGYLWDDAAQMWLCRFRWLDPVAGRWINRDPAGYVDGGSLYEYTSSSPVESNDWSGLYKAPGHYYSAFVAARCAGMSVQSAQNFAYYAQFPDQRKQFDGYEAGWRRSLRLLGNLGSPPDSKDEQFDKDIQEYIHSLHGGDAAAIARWRRCLASLMKSGKLRAWEQGVVAHAYQDSFAHTKGAPGSEKAYGGRWGHAADTVGIGGGQCPDEACNNGPKFQRSLNALIGTMRGATGAGPSSDVAKACSDAIWGSGLHGNNHDRWIMDMASNLGLPPNSADFMNEEFGIDANRFEPSREDMQRLLDKIKQFCCPVGTQGQKN
jgi:RHS repeat-associated protein